MSKQYVVPTPSNPTYLDRGTYQFLIDLCRPTRVGYDSPLPDFIRNEVLKEIEGIIKVCIVPKD